MISHLPRWIEYGAFLLALLAGCINVIGLLGLEHQSISHVSGTATLLGLGIISDHGSTLHLILLLISFTIGAALSGYLIGNSALEAGHNYGNALIIEGILLMVAMLLLNTESGGGHYFASAACGLQNALITTYSGAIIRTTHLTGVFTDLGLMLGQRGRGEQIDRRRATLYLLIISGFILGATAGALLFDSYRFSTLLLPITLAFTLAVTYKLFIKKVK